MIYDNTKHLKILFSHLNSQVYPKLQQQPQWKHRICTQ